MSIRPPSKACAIGVAAQPGRCRGRLVPLPAEIATGLQSTTLRVSALASGTGCYVRSVNAIMRESL